MDESRIACYIVFFMIFARAEKTSGENQILSRCIGHARSFPAMYENHFVL